MVLYTADGRRELQIYALNYVIKLVLPVCPYLTTHVTMFESPCGNASTDEFMYKTVRANKLCCSTKAEAMLCNTVKGHKHVLVQAGMLTGVASCAAAAKRHSMREDCLHWLVA